MSDDTVHVTATDAAKIGLIGASQGVLCALASITAQYGILAGLQYSWTPKTPWWAVLSSFPFTAVLFFVTLPWADSLVQKACKPVNRDIVPNKETVDSPAEPEYRGNPDTGGCP